MATFSALMLLLAFGLLAGTARQLRLRRMRMARLARGAPASCWRWR